MPVNFGMLQAAPPQAQIMQIPIPQPPAPPPPPSSGGDSGGGLGELLSGLSGLMGGLGGGGGGDAPSPSAPSMEGSLSGQQLMNNIQPPAPQMPQMMSPQMQGRPPSAQAPMTPQQVGQMPTGLNTTLPNPMQSKYQSAFDLANQFKGMNEVQNKATLTNFFARSGVGEIDPTKTPWCAAFVSGAFQANGIQGPKNGLSSQDYLNWGTPTNKPQIGDVAVLNFGKPGKGHVGFYAGQDKNGKVQILGGNQSDTVSIKSFDPSQVVGYRTPPSIKELETKGIPNVTKTMVGQNKNAAMQNMPLIGDPSKRPPLSQQINSSPYIVKQNSGETREQAIERQRKDNMQLVSNKYGLANAHPELDNTMKGIRWVESRGSKNAYSLQGPNTGKMGRALGAYQIMEKNVPSWSKESLGRSVSREEFLSNPDIQDKIAAYKLNQYLNKTGSRDESAHMWFGGPGWRKNANARDAFGTSQPEYVKVFNQGINRRDDGSPDYKGMTPTGAPQGVNFAQLNQPNQMGQSKILMGGSGVGMGQQGSSPGGPLMQPGQGFQGAPQGQPQMMGGQGQQPGQPMSAGQGLMNAFQSIYNQPAPQVAPSNINWQGLFANLVR